MFDITEPMRRWALGASPEDGLLVHTSPDDVAVGELRFPSRESSSSNRPRVLTWYE